MEYGYRPENPAPEGNRDAAPSAKAASFDPQDLKDKFTGNSPTSTVPLVEKKGKNYDRTDVVCHVR